MRKILVLTATMLIAHFANSQMAYSQSLDCNQGSFGIGYVQQNPTSDSLQGIGGVSFDVTFLRKNSTYFNTSFGIEANFSNRTFNRAVEDINFEGGYTGFVDYSQSRSDILGRFTIGAQLGKIVEIGFPVRMGWRRIQFNEEFDLYEGQEIAEEDLVSEDEASEENTDAFFTSNSIALGTGINIAILPNARVSPFFEYNFNYFGATEMPMPQNAELVGGFPSVPSVDLSNNNETTFRIGVRFNLGCPSNRSDIYRAPISNRRTAAYQAHPTVETKIVKRKRNRSSSRSNNNSNQRVILNPTSRSPRKPQQ